MNYILYLLKIVICISGHKFLCQKVGLGSVSQAPRNICIVSLCESGEQLWVQSLSSKLSLIRAGHGPSSNICSQHNYFK